MKIAKHVTASAKRALRITDQLLFKPRTLDAPIRVAVVGLGKAGQYHLSVLEQIGGVEVTCLVHRGGSDPSALMKRYGISTCHTGIEAALSARDFDAAIIAVSWESTSEVASAFLEAGVHCLIEKPLGVTVEAAEELRDCAARSQVTSAVGYNRRCYSAVLEATRYVDALGAPYSIHVDSPERLLKIRKSGESSEASRVRIVTNTCHAIDVFTVFAGEHERVFTTGVTRFFEEIPIDYLALIQFRKQQTGQFSSHWLSPGDRIVTLYGRDYRLAIDMVRNLLKVTTGKKEKIIRPSRIDRIFKPGVYQQDFEFLAAASRGLPVGAPLASLEDACHTQRLACDLLAAGGATETR